MAQKRFIPYKAPVDSFPLAEARVGMFKPGRYNGFNQMTEISGLNIRIAHKDIVKKTSPANVAQNNFGKLMMPTGIIIQEDAPLEFNIEPNNTSNNRIDLIVCEHTYQEIQNGSVATYSILKGPSSGSKPSLPSPQKQVIVGWFKVAPNTTNFSGLIYHPAFVPLLGDRTLEEEIAAINNAIEHPTASETQKGIIEIATTQEAKAGSATRLAVTPKTLKEVLDQYSPSTGTPEVITTTVVEKGTSFGLEPEHNGKLILVQSVAAITSVTIGNNLPDGFEVSVMWNFSDNDYLQGGTGMKKVNTPSNKRVEFRTSGGSKVLTGKGDKLTGLGSMAFIKKVASNNIFVLTGDLKQ